MDLLNETVLLKTKSTLFNLLIRETSQFLCYERLLNMTYVTYKNAFPAKCNSGRIAIQWFHMKHHLDYQYTKFQPYTFQVQKNVCFCTIRDFGSPTNIQGFVQMSDKRENLYTNQEKIGSILHFKNGVTYYMPSVPKRGTVRHNIRTMPY